VRRAGVIAVLGVFALAACGSSARVSKAQYEQRLSSIGTKAGTALTSIFSNPAVTNPRSLKQAAELVRRGATTIDDAGSQIKKLHPPADADALNDDLAKGFHQLADELRQFSAAAEHGDVAKVKAFDQQAGANSLPGEQAIQRAIEALKRKSYRVGSG
jgi:hypothetical protein